MVASMLVDDIADRIAIACPAEIDGIVRDMWVNHTHGRLTDNEAEVLDEAAGARREAIQTRRTETRPKPRTGPKGAPRGSAHSLRSIRSRTRRRLHEPRPAVSHETRKRIGQWKTEVKAAAKDRQIRAVDRLYADELLAFPSVARGHYNLCSDATMGQRLDVSDSTARRQRRRLDKAGLIEVLGYGQDGNSCLVRPILRDGTPVFPDPEMPSRPVTSDHPPRSELTADLSTETPKAKEPPLPPASPDATGEGGEAFDQLGSQMQKRPLQTDLRQRWKIKSEAFAKVDDFAHRFKHTETGNPANPRRAKEVVTKGGAFSSEFSAGFDIGKVTLENDPSINLLVVVKDAAAFVQAQISSVP
jgi:hypothetical protein